MSLLQHASNVSLTGALISRTQLQLNAMPAYKSTKDLALDLVCHTLSARLSHGIVTARPCMFDPRQVMDAYPRRLAPRELLRSDFSGLCPSRYGVFFHHL